MIRWCIAAGMAVGFVGCEMAAPTRPVEQSEWKWGVGTRTGALRVLTRNVFVGADVDMVLGAESPEDIPLLAAQAFQQLLASDFPDRAAAFASEIETTRPHLIGLQEISLVRVQHPGDAVVGGTVPAETEVIDFLDVLLTALEARGLDYRAAAAVQDADVEVPMVVSLDPLAFSDVRLTDFDVILARADVETSDVAAANYDARLSVPVGPMQLEVPRGYAAVTATVDGRSYRFVNTHLEPSNGDTHSLLTQLQLAQAGELVAAIEDTELPLVVVGDLNTHAPWGQTYAFMRERGFVDAWDVAIDKKSDGLTCCHAADLGNELVEFDRRIDLILVRGTNGGDPFAGNVQIEVIGDQYGDRTPNGRWPSDHGGLVAEMRLHP